MGYDEAEQSAAQEEYARRLYVGVGHADSVPEAMQKAYEMAWGRANREGHGDVPLRVAEQHVWGSNPPNWYRVVLEAGSG